MMICGIDLGTTFSTISWYDAKNNRVNVISLPSEDTNPMLLRSVVYYPAPGEAPVVGEVAYSQYRLFPNQVAVGVKRQMGRDWTFKPFDGVEYTPEEVSAEILKTLLKEAKAFMGGETFEAAVITVPAYFEEQQRKATRKAARLASQDPELPDFTEDKIHILEEPAAAALAYCLENALDQQEKYILVYDLGGGTFDVALTHSSWIDRNGQNQLKIETLIKKGNASMGGLKWDEQLANLVHRKALAEHNVDVRASDTDAADLEVHVEKGKRQGSKLDSFVITATISGSHYQVEVSRPEFEDETSTLLDATRDLLREVLADADQAGIPRDRIQVLLAGGSTRMPMVRKMIEAETRKPPLLYGNPDLLVSMGAAYWGHLKTNGKIDVKGEEVELPPDPISYAPYAVGIEGLRNDGRTKYHDVILKPRTKYGVSNSVIRGKSRDSMTSVRIVIYKSDTATEDLQDCTQVAVFTLGPLPPGGKKGEEVTVELGHTAEGILCGKAVDVQTGQAVDIRIEREKLKAI